MTHCFRELVDQGIMQSDSQQAGMLLPIGHSGKAAKQPYPESDHNI